jgi:hypothetical protein
MTSYPLTAIFNKKKSRIFKSVSPVVDESSISKAFAREGSRERVYHAWPLFQMWLHQSATGASCRQTVSWAMCNGVIPPYVSPKTAAYCNARVHFPEAPMREILVSTGRAVEGSADRRRYSFHRRALVVDGTSVQLQDTPENQREYPQPKGQKPGCGQPVMSAVALMGLGSGAIVDIAVGGGFGHERALFRKLWPSLVPGDVLIADNGFCSYADFACLTELGVDLVMAQRDGCLKNRKVQEIGDGDYIVLWPRGKQKLKWIERDALPDQLIVRAVVFSYIGRDGRSVGKVLFTTLLDPALYPRGKIVELYRRRWEVEISFDDIKTEMGFDLLRCKSPKQCRCELFMGLIAYNIVRAVMLDAARHARLAPRRISFTGTLVRIRTFLSGLVFSKDPALAYAMLVKHLAIDQVPRRPGRHEPRKVKRRPKNYRRLNSPRNPSTHAPSNP